MRKLLLAATLLVGSVALASAADAVTTWQGTSLGVPNEETGGVDYYTVSFTFDDSVAKFITPLTAQDPAHTPFTRSLFENIISFSVTGGTLGTVGFNSGTAFVSTLAPALAQYGSVPFLVLAGTDGIATPGYQLQFAYTPTAAYGSTMMPTALDIAAVGADAGFNLLRFDYDGDPADEIIGDPLTVLNFRFATGGFLPAATAAVPEPASWALMVAGFGLIGCAMRRRWEAVARA